MVRKQEMNEFIAEYVKNYDGDSYEASAEQEDIANACKSAIQWADRTMIDRVCDFVIANVYKYGKVKFVDNRATFDFRTNTFLNDLKQVIEE